VNPIKKAPPPTRTDPLGNQVPIPQGHFFKVGRNLRGIAIKRGSRTTEDKFGQLYEIPIGHRVVHKSDGSISVIGDEEAPKKRKASPPKSKTAQRLSILEVLKLLGEMASPPASSMGA
jgi:hypothetical protein